MLADSAQVSDGKLYVLGAGWSVIGPDPSPFAIAGMVEVPWDRAKMDVSHQLKLELLDSDGKAVKIGPSEDEAEPVALMSDFRLERDPALKPGTPITMPFAFNMMMPLPPGHQLVWRLSIDGWSADDWRLGFITRPLPPAMAA